MKWRWKSPSVPREYKCKKWQLSYWSMSETTIMMSNQIYKTKFSTLKKKTFIVQSYGLVIIENISVLQVWRELIHTENETWHNYSESYDSTHTFSLFWLFHLIAHKFLSLAEAIQGYNDKIARESSPLTSQQLRRDAPDFIPVGERANDGSTHRRIPPYWIVASGSRVESPAHVLQRRALTVGRSQMGWLNDFDSLTVHYFDEDVLKCSSCILTNMEIITYFRYI